MIKYDKKSIPQIDPYFHPLGQTKRSKEKMFSPHTKEHLKAKLSQVLVGGYSLE